MVDKDGSAKTTGIDATDHAEAALHAIARSLPDRINADPERVEQGLAKLVLTLIQLIIRLLERQAMHRIDAGSLTDDEIERLAEIEHGRWNLERLTSGWQLGERRVSRRLTPYLAPWTELNDDVKEYDRESVRNIGPALEACGWGVVDA